jgi:glycosyltransferase involved in cell wall biosynthesis
MHILFIVPYSPTRIRVRPYNLIKHLAQRENLITLATVWEDEEEFNALKEFERLGVQVISQPLQKTHVLANTGRTFFSSTPLQARYSWQPALAEQLSELLTSNPKRWDIIHVEHLRGAQYGLHLKAQLTKNGLSIPIVWDSVDCISLLFEGASRSSRSGFGRWITRFELPRTRRFEGFLVHQFERVLATSPQDKRALDELGDQYSGASPPGASNITVLPNGVDLEYFSPIPNRGESDIIIFTGKLSYHANQTAATYLANDIMPHIWEGRPQTKLQLVGKDPPVAIRRLGERENRIRVTGYVPDMRDYLWEASLAIAPLVYGAGIQNKVLEAMACGIPVAASSQAVSALGAVPGRDVLVADEPQEIAAAALQLLDDPHLNTQVGASGRAYVERHHDWNSIAAQLENIYRETIGNLDSIHNTG